MLDSYQITSIFSLKGERYLAANMTQERLLHEFPRRLLWLLGYGDILLSIHREVECFFFFFREPLDITKEGLAF